MQPRCIILSRTDSIGDVVLALPMTGVIKEHYPECKIVFLGRTYTRPVVECCTQIDEFLNWDEWSGKATGEQLKKLKETSADVFIHVFPRKKISKLAMKAKIPVRIGTSHRLYHFGTCNKKVSFTRRRSNLHEAQLNLKLLQPLGILADTMTLELIAHNAGFTKTTMLPEKWRQLLSANKMNLILHAKSQGSAAEWGLQNFKELINLLPGNKFKIFITGTEDEGKMIRPIVEGLSGITDLTGQLSLNELIAFIKEADALVAASTGPLHLAGVLGKHAIGLYSPRKPIHPGRWSPLGAHSKTLVFDYNCAACKAGKACDCIKRISPERVAGELLSLAAK